jgi:glucose/arabinose dehydrogenase
MTEEMRVAETETAPEVEVDAIAAGAETCVDIAVVARGEVIVTTDRGAVAVGGTIEIGDVIDRDPAIAAVVANL